MRGLLVLWLTGCGRIGFAEGGDSISDGAIDGVSSDAMAAMVHYAGQFSARLDVGGGVSQTFSKAAAKAGNAVVFQVACKSTATPTGVQVSAPNWQITQLSGIAGAGPEKKWFATFGAIAPDTANAEFTIIWAVTNCTDRNHLVDEFTNNDATGGTTTFDAHVEASGTGNCSGSITTAQDGDAVWAGCTSSVQLGSPGTGYTKGADDAAGDFAVFELPSKPAGSVETILVAQNNGNSFELSAVTIRRQ